MIESGLRLLLPVLVLLLTYTGVFAQDYIVKIDGEVLSPVKIVKENKHYLEYTFGVNPLKRNLGYIQIAYFIRDEKRYDYNPFKTGITDPRPQLYKQTVSNSPEAAPIPPADAPKSDLIMLHDGSRIKCRVDEVSADIIHYRRVDESTKYSLSRLAIYKIQFVSGREEELSSRVSIAGSEGWQNVILTENPDDVVGLRKLGETSSKSISMFRSIKGADKTATQRIRKEAVELGGHVILLSKDQASGSAAYKASQSYKVGIVYGYNAPAVSLQR